jgi:hypothetical protein
MFENSPEVSVLRAPDRNRQFLIVIRSGSGARPSLFHGPLPEDRNFDVAVNYFEPPHSEDFFHDHAEFLVAGGLSKYQAAKHFLHSIGLDRYEGVWFLDDDIELHCDPAEFFRYCSERGFDIAQAALTHSSDSAWKITYCHPGFEYRLTNFVEVMAPYFSRDFLMTVVEAFDMSISTYGLDVFWGSQLEAHQSAAIVDRFLMSHLRRRDFGEGAYYAYLRSLGIDCFKEMRNVLDSLGVESYEIRLKGGVDIVESVRVG